MLQLAELQSQFARALRNPDQDVPQCLGLFNGHSGDRCNGRFDVYRNNMMVNTIEALKIVYPAVKQLVGEDYFRAAARAFVQAHPPRNPVLLHYGDGFGRFLEDIPSASNVPYLSDVAHLEWACTRAFHAKDAGTAGIEELAGVPESLVDKVTLTLHPSLGLVASRWPVVSLRAASLADAQDNKGSTIKVDMNASQRALVIRPELNVTVHPVSLQHWIFICALQQSMTIGEAAALAMESTKDFDLASVLGGIFQVGAVTAVKLP